MADVHHRSLTANNEPDTTMTLTNPKDGASIDSRYSTDQEAYDALVEKLNSDERARTPFTLAMKEAFEHRSKKAMSPSQRYWLHKKAAPVRLSAQSQRRQRRLKRCKTLQKCNIFRAII